MISVGAENIGKSARSNELPQSSANQWVEQTLIRYPDVSEDELQRLIAWFKVASALDVGLVASNDRLHDAYAALCEEHLDRFTWSDLVRAFLFVLVFGGGIVGIILLGMR